MGDCVFVVFMYGYVYVVVWMVVDGGGSGVFGD